MNLTDAVVVITGAGKGLGRAIALAFKEEEAQLVVSSHPSDGSLSEVAQEIAGRPVIADVTKEIEVRRLAQATIEQFGRIDVWVNNAGIWIPHAPFEEVDFERVHELIEVNLFGTMYGSREALVQMKKQASGTIVNIISASGLEPHAFSAAYCASKYAASGFTKSLRQEVEEAGVTVIGVYPGRMKTALFDEVKPDDYETYLDPTTVAQAIVKNLMQEESERELVIG